MSYLIIALKLIVGLSLLNVWLLNSNKPSKYRPGNAQDIFEEFELYGLPKSFCYIIGFLKVTLSLLLIASIWLKQMQNPAAIGLAVLLLGSIVMHLKVKDPIKKSFPAALLLVLCLAIVLL
ncbi:DoxX family protein [bacterium]|nr:DoxX family protein [bacterium]